MKASFICHKDIVSSRHVRLFRHSDTLADTTCSHFTGHSTELCKRGSGGYLWFIYYSSYGMHIVWIL